MTGSIIAGENIITVNYRDKMSRFSVIGEAAVTLESISATYTGGDVPGGTLRSELTGITVTAHYSDGSSKNVTDYKISNANDAIVEGRNTVWITYNGGTDAVFITGIANSGEGDEPTSGLVMRTGTTTSSSIDTGLSSIKQFVLYRKTVNAPGLIDLSYNADLGTKYTMCTNYNTIMSGGISATSTYVAINGGIFNWNATLASDMMATGVTYTWVAIGEN
jgi:hypothetical protein